ncbi:hypothetical protein AHAS_Ahas18G0124700 [Arachis hypogaea]
MRIENPYWITMTFKLILSPTTTMCFSMITRTKETVEIGNAESTRRLWSTNDSSTLKSRKRLIKKGATGRQSVAPKLENEVAE